MRTDVFFLAQNLDAGGSQRQLITLAAALARRGLAVTIATFYEGGALLSEARAAGVRVVSLDKQGRWDLLAFLLRLARLVRRERPKVIHGYLDVPNLLTLLLRWLSPDSKAVWGVRMAYVNWARYDRVTRLSFAIGCRLSRFADLIILNSRAGLRHHRDLGYPEARMVVVPNGIDTDTFAPDAEARRRVREGWGVHDDHVLVGLVARLDPLKGHEVFLDAAAELSARDGTFRFVCVGQGTRERVTALRAYAERNGLAAHIIWAGERSDVPAVYNALDIAVSSSTGEGFSNVIGESLATGVPCVVTDTGDSADIVGDPRLVVPPSDAPRLAQAIADAASRRSPEWRDELRGRVVAQFSVSRLAERTMAALSVGTAVARVPELGIVSRG